MPLNRIMPDKPTRAAANVTTLVGANSDAPKVLAFTVPVARKFTLLEVGTDQNSASVDLLAQKVVGTQAITLVDLVTQRLSTDERGIPVWEEFKAGDSLNIGIRNRTGAGITPQLYWVFLDEPA